MTFGPERHTAGAPDVSPRFWHEGSAPGLAEPGELAAAFVAIPPAAPPTNSASPAKFRPGRLVGTVFMIGVFGATAYVAGALEPGLFATASVPVQNHTSPEEPTPPAPPLDLPLPPPADPPQPRTADAASPAPPAPPTAPPVLAQQPERRLPRKKPPPRHLPTIAIEQVAGTPGIDAVAIRVAVDPLRPQLRRCHASAIDRGLLGTVRITAKMTVRGAAVESVEPAASISSPQLWHCVRGVLRTAVFKTTPPYAEATVEIRLGPPDKR